MKKNLKKYLNKRKTPRVLLQGLTCSFFYILHFCHYKWPKIIKIFLLIEWNSIFIHNKAIISFGCFKDFLFYHCDSITLNRFYNRFYKILTSTDDCISFHKKPPAVLDDSVQNQLYEKIVKLSIRKTTNIKLTIKLCDS